MFTTCFMYGISQVSINPYSNKKISKSTIEIIYSQYLGDGDHSAITGGIGTEKLIVYEPEIILKHQIDSLRASWVDAGVDVILKIFADSG